MIGYSDLVERTDSRPIESIISLPHSHDDLAGIASDGAVIRTLSFFHAWIL